MPTIEELEDETKSLTLEKHDDVADVITTILNVYIDGFRRLGNFDIDKDNRKELAWLLLTSRAFNSLRNAYELALKGYYSQSLTLTRSALEDWLASQDCGVNSATIEALLSGEGDVPRSREMVARLPDALNKDWRGVEGEEGLYGVLSTLSHPRQRALNFAYDPVSSTLRFGPLYDEDLFIFTAYYMIIVARRMAEFVARLVAPKDPTFPDDALPVMNESNAMLDQLEQLAIARTEAK